MRVKLLGYQKVDFKDDSGSGIRGTSIFISYTENGVQGEKAEKKFLPDGFGLPALHPGDFLDLDCNTRGKILRLLVANTTGTNVSKP